MQGCIYACACAYACVRKLKFWVNLCILLCCVIVFVVVGFDFWWFLARLSDFLCVCG